jgi:hypothetical protein
LLRIDPGHYHALHEHALRQRHSRFGRFLPALGWIACLCFLLNLCVQPPDQPRAGGVPDDRVKTFTPLDAQVLHLVTHHTIPT